MMAEQIDSGSDALQLSKNAYTKWINAHLRNEGLEEITDIFYDFRDGTLLLKLIKILTGKTLSPEKGRMRSHHIQNVTKGLEFLQNEEKIDLVVNSAAIVDGKPTLTMGLVWKLILHYEIASTETGDKSKTPKQLLLQWTQTITQGYVGVSVTNFHTSWRDGMAFCALIHYHKPNLLDYDSCDPNEPIENLKKAFTVAETQLGVPPLLDPKDVYVSKPSEEAILMYVSKLKQSFYRDPNKALLDRYAIQCSTLKNQIISRSQFLAERKELPPKITEIRKILQEFQALRNTEDPQISTEIEELGRIAKELDQSNENISPIEALEEIWLLAVNESNDYENQLLSELENLVKRDSETCSFPKVNGAVVVQMFSILIVIGIYLWNKSKD